MNDAKGPGGADKQATRAEGLHNTTFTTTHFTNCHTGTTSFVGTLELQTLDLKSDQTADRRTSEQVATL